MKRILRIIDVFLAVLAVITTATSAYSLTQGPRSGTSFASVPRTGSTHAWFNESAANASDDNWAENGVDPTTTVSEYLEATGFGFTIPAGSTIDGVEVEIEKNCGASSLIDDIVTLCNGGSNIGTNHALGATNWPFPDAYVKYGSSTDGWGASLTPAIVNSATFGVRLGYTKTICPACFSFSTYVDHIRITIYYSGGLAAELSYIKAVQESFNSIRLDWQTLSESGVDHFSVERSFDGIMFTGIGTVNAAGSSATAREYLFFDEIQSAHQHIGISAYYYRLRQIDYNGSSDYSEIVKVNPDIPNEKFSLAGITTTAGMSNIRFILLSAGEAEYAVLDMTGSRMLSGNLGWMKEGINTAQISTAELPPGICYLILRSGQETVSGRMLLY